MYVVSAMICSSTGIAARRGGADSFRTATARSRFDASCFDAWRAVFPFALREPALLLATFFAELAFPRFVVAVLFALFPFALLLLVLFLAALLAGAFFFELPLAGVCPSASKGAACAMAAGAAMARARRRIIMGRAARSIFMISRSICMGVLGVTA
jgi:hypothetical protein